MKCLWIKPNTDISIIDTEIYCYEQYDNDFCIPVESKFTINNIDYYLVYDADKIGDGIPNKYLDKLNTKYVNNSITGNVFIYRNVDNRICEVKNNDLKIIKEVIS